MAPINNVVNHGPVTSRALVKVTAQEDFNKLDILSFDKGGHAVSEIYPFGRSVGIGQLKILQTATAP